MKIISVFDAIPAHEKRITLSTLFTLLRIVLVPIIIYVMVHQQWEYALSLFLVAALTDVIDGKLARLLDERTVLGASLDAIADKLLVISSFATFACVQSPVFTLPIWFFVMVLIKESLLILGVIYIFFTKGSLQIAPTLLGKMTMLAQVCFIVWLFCCYVFRWFPLKTYYGMLSLIVCLIMGSLVQYTVIGCKYFLSSPSIVN